MNTGAGLMREHGIAAEAKRKFRGTTDSDRDRPVAAAMPDRRFEPEAPNQARTADLTAGATAAGRPDPAAVEALDSRRIAGRSMGARIDSRPVVDARETAPSRRLPGAGVVARWGRGSRSAGEHYRRT